MTLQQQEQDPENGINSYKSFRLRERMTKYANVLKVSSRSLELKQDPNKYPLGVSVFHLCTNFTDSVKEYNTEVLGMEFEDVKIYNIEDLRNDTGFIREKGKTIISKEDNCIGASYVDCLEGDDNVGIATHMLSYSWGNTVKDITSALSDFCKNNDLDPKRVYIWICCLCVNQHRVKEKLKRGETVPFNSFGKKFKKRVLGINNLLCLMIPLDEPIYLKRIWCIYEYYMGIMNDCNINIIMPSSEQEKLVNMVRRNKMSRLFYILGSTKIEEADASEESDKESILTLVKEGPGYDFVNAAVNTSLRQWIFETLAETAKKEEEKSHDSSTDTDLSLLLNNIGWVCKDNGKYNEAIESFTKSLLIRKKVFGKEHQRTAKSYNNIGICYNYKGKYDSALEYFSKAVIIREKVLGKNHKDTATSYNSIGACYNNKKDHDLALDYYFKALSIYEKVFGKKHQYTAMSYANIGAVYKEKGDYDTAMEYQQKCLTIREKVYDTNHPITASSYSLIGELYTAKSDYTTAMEYLKKSQMIREKLIGKNHPFTAISYHHMGELNYHMDNLDDAAKYIRLALEIRVKEFGKNHPKTLETNEWHDKIVEKGIKNSTHGNLC